ncbi:1-deoxy-D-xylulose-5-phosphate reductoisomerase [Sphingorhabdus sp. Alg231-15]|uniref:1-deoxy-D-xylulose-5-phosphate reductoisomerase n=1 Tax=Sphingorhabdus sp. Alg231-15 TaxID=1922222 RepID=UPI000D560738
MTDPATRTISIFGATGSVGTSTLDLIRLERDKYRVVALTANSDAEGLAKLAKEFDAQVAVIADASRYEVLNDLLAGTGTEVAAGPDKLVDAASLGADWTMAAIVGCAGLPPTLAALQCGKTVALANKEALVSAGALMMAEAQQAGAILLPVDSEHNAIFQCLQGGRIDQVRKITLTASGGPFRTWSREQMTSVTPAQAVAHPNWDMGAKISVDSATMMNKGLELIEAHHLFPVGLENIDILVHPQSVIHSMVEYHDCSTLAQLGSPDMRIPIASALAWPERMKTDCLPLDLTKIATLNFEAPDHDRFPAIKLARNAIEAGGAVPAILNAANEVAVAGFLNGDVQFLEITDIVSHIIDSYSPPNPDNLADIFEIDTKTRERVSAMIEGIKV